MNDWSPGESEVEWSDDGAETGWGSDETDVGLEANESQTEQQRFVGRHLLPTLRWSVRALRRSPFLIAVALVVSALETFVLNSPTQLLAVVPDPVRWLASVFGIMLVGAFAAVLVEDTRKERHRSSFAQVVAVVRSLPALLVTFAVFSVPLYFFVFLPAVAIPFAGPAFGLVVGTYLGSMFLFVVPAVVLDQSITQGHVAFAETRRRAIALFAMLVLGHVPLAVLPPSLATLPIMAGFALVAGVLTGILTLASARMYAADDSEQYSDGDSDQGWVQEHRAGNFARTWGDEADTHLSGFEHLAGCPNVNDALEMTTAR